MPITRPKTPTEAGEIQPSRRTFALGAGLLGLSFPVTAAAAAASTRARTFALSDGNAHLIATLLRTDLVGVRLGGFEGEVFGFGTDGALRPLMGVRGMSRARLVDAGARIVHEEIGVYCDLLTGEPLQPFRNPFTGAMVTPAYLSARIETTRADLRADANRTLKLVQGVLVQKVALTPVTCCDHGPVADDPVRTTQVTSFVADPAALAAADQSPVSVHGEWLRSGPWPRWLNMADGAGPCLHRCRFETGAQAVGWLDDLKPGLAGHPLEVFA